MNVEKDWKPKLEIACSFMLKYSKITECLISLQGVGNKRGGGAKTPELINEKGGIFRKT